MENGAFALLEQMLHFPYYYFQIHDISKASFWTIGLRVCHKKIFFLFLKTKTDRYDFFYNFILKNFVHLNLCKNGLSYINPIT